MLSLFLSNIDGGVGGILSREFKVSGLMMVGGLMIFLQVQEVLCERYFLGGRVTTIRNGSYDRRCQRGIAIALNAKEAGSEV